MNEYFEKICYLHIHFNSETKEPGKFIHFIRSKTESTLFKNINNRFVFGCHFQYCLDIILHKYVQKYYEINIDCEDDMHFSWRPFNENNLSETDDCQIYLTDDIDSFQPFLK
jgi:hypothetical protein